MDDEHVRGLRDEGDRCKIPQDVPRNVLEQRNHPERAAEEEQRIPIGCGFGYRLSCERPAGPPAAFDEHLMTEYLREFLGDDSCGEFVSTAWLGSDDANRFQGK